MYRLTEEQKAFVEELLSKMTLEEKIGQMHQESVSIVGGFDLSFEEMIEMLTDGRLSQSEFESMMSKAEQDFHEDSIRAGEVGSYMIQDPVKANELQKIAVEESRLGIPLMFGLDVIHGFRTVYPIAIAEAGTFDTGLFEKTARMAAKESRQKGVNWHFAPMVDVARDARWGRVSEGPGEDPYLVTEFAKAKVRGQQGDQSAPENYVASCLKHYVAYGACEGGRDYNTTSMSISQLHNVYLPPFKAAVEEGAATVMASFNDLNGVPCTVNEYTLRKLLKNTFGLKGFVVSDANAIRECVTHGIAADNVDAGEQAVRAGLDVDMGTSIFHQYLAESVRSGKVDIALVDDAVRRILTVKKWLGLFEHPYVSEESMKASEVVPAENTALALEAAKRSIVLLKNEENLLPLKKGQKVSLVGELADRKEEIIGAWAMSWKPEDCISIREGLEKALEGEMNYFACGGPSMDVNEEEIRAAGEYGDVIVAVVGELDSMSGEASSRAEITLPGEQRKMLEMLLKTGKPVIALLMNGRPLALSWEDEHLSAMVECWHLGVQMGNAVASVLTGETNPSGKLASSFPRVSGQCPVYYNHPSTGRPGGSFKFTSRYLDIPNGPLYPFGYGLSYTKYDYSELTVDEQEDSLIISVQVKNTGEVSGTETVLFFMQDVAGSIVRPVKELKGFAKVELAPGEEKTAAIELPKAKMGFYNNDAEYVCEDGLFRIYAGANAGECLMHEMEVKF